MSDHWTRRCLTPEEYALEPETVVEPDCVIDVGDPEAPARTFAAAQPIVCSTTGVYFLRSAGFIKIGLARCVIRRWRGLMLASGARIDPLGYVPVDSSYQDARRLERRLHLQFAESRHHGEWFSETRELAQFIAEHASPWPQGRT